MWTKMSFSVVPSYENPSLYFYLVCLRFFRLSLPFFSRARIEKYLDVVTTFVNVVRNSIAACAFAEKKAQTVIFRS